MECVKVDDITLLEVQDGQITVFRDPLLEENAESWKKLIVIGEVGSSFAIYLNILNRLKQASSNRGKSTETLILEIATAMGQVGLTDFVSLVETRDSGPLELQQPREQQAVSNDDLLLESDAAPSALSTLALSGNDSFVRQSL